MTRPIKPTKTDALKAPDNLQKSQDLQGLQDLANLKDLILRLMPPMATMTAVSLAGVSLYQLHGRLDPATTFVDETLALCAVLFLAGYPLTIWAVRTTHTKRAFILARLTLAVFLLAIGLVIYSGLCMLIQLA